MVMKSEDNWETEYFKKAIPRSQVEEDKPELVPLAQWNASRKAQYNRREATRRTGVACPLCHGELFTIPPGGVTLAGNPERSCRCEECGHYEMVAD